jgi:virulence factor
MMPNKTGLIIITKGKTPNVLFFLFTRQERAKSMNDLRIGVIGVGRMGQHHCRNYSNLKDVKFVGVYDINPQIAAETSASYDVTSFPRLEDLLDQVDAVSIATTTPTHFDIAKKCLERKIHVLIEKPVTEKVEDAEQLAEVMQKNNVVVQVGHIERFNPTYVELIKVLADQKVLAISFRRLSPYRVSNKDVDVVLDLMVHDLDLCNDITKEKPILVNANGLMPFSHSLDHVVAQLTYTNGPLITLTASRVTEQKIRLVDVTSEDTFIEADFMNKGISIYRCTSAEFSTKGHNGVTYHQESVIERILVPNVEPLSVEIKNFVDSIKMKCAPRVSIFDGINALRLAKQICSLVYNQNHIFVDQPTTKLEKEDVIIDGYPYSSNR